MEREARRRRRGLTPLQAKRAARTPIEQESSEDKQATEDKQSGADKQSGGDKQASGDSGSESS